MEESTAKVAWLGEATQGNTMASLQMPVLSDPEAAFVDIPPISQCHYIWVSTTSSV